MKRILRILVLAVTLVTGLTTVSAQTVQVIVNQRVSNLPTAATNYLDDPFRYFNVQFIVNGAGSEGIDIYYDMDFSVTTKQEYYFHTKPGSFPTEKIHLQNGVNMMGRDELITQLRNKRLQTNILDNPIGAQQMPEGTYQLCMDIYLWEDRERSNNLTIGPCPTFDLCYSGSAPELVSPLAGAQMALNGTMVVTPARKINFLWTPVISNCATNRSRFKYMFKVVKVLYGQNYQDAIKYNPTVFSAEVRNNNFIVLDTLRDVKVQLERGALYVAQVQAEKIMSSRSTDDYIIANDGKSQPMPFFWGYADNAYSGMMNSSVHTTRTYGYTVDDESDEDDESEGVEGMTVWEGGVEEESDLATIIEEMKEQYLAGFIQDAATVASLVEAYPEERQYVPTPKRRYVESDGYYTVPMTDDLEMSFMPLRHESLKDISYAIEVYDYIDGDIDSITSYEPILSETVEELPERYNKMDSHELVTRTLKGWGSKLEQGNLYYLQLSSYYTVNYWQYQIADTVFYVNEMLAEHVHDTVSRDFVEEHYMYSNGVFFQWGDDPEAPACTTPQWKAPLNRTGDDIYDPANYRIPTTVPEVKKAKTFPVSWTPVKDVAQGDYVEYEVNVYEVKDGQTLEEAVAVNEALVSRTVTDATEIAEDDAKFFKVFSSGKTYVMTLSTNVYGESDVMYHFENGNEALPVIFKVVK